METVKILYKVGLAKIWLVLKTNLEVKEKNKQNVFYRSQTDMKIYYNRTRTGFHKIHVLDPWTKIYNQVAATTAFRPCKLGDCKITIDADNFLDFDLIGDRSVTGPYRFKLEWEKNNEITYLEWTQEVHPLAVTEEDRVWDQRTGTEM